VQKRVAHRTELWSARVSRAGFGVAPKQAFLKTRIVSSGMKPEKFATARHRRQHARRVCSPEKNQNWTISHTSTPTQRVGLVWPRPHRPALILLFAKKFFRVVGSFDPDRGHRPRLQQRMRWTGQIFWLLAYDACAARTFFPPSPPKLSGIGPMGSRIQLQQRNCSRFSRDSCADPLFQARKELGPRSSASRSGTQDLLALSHKPPTQWDNGTVGRERFLLRARREQPRRVCRSK